MSQQTVPKVDFARHLRGVADASGNGFFIVLTPANAPVMLRLSRGQITTSHCRGYDIQNAIDMLAPASEVRYSFRSASAEDKPALIEVDDFLQAIDAYVLSGQGNKATPNGTKNVERRLAEPVDPAVEAQLLTLATEVIGPVATLIVEDALERSSTVRQAIGEIHGAIPDPNAADRFVQIARSRISG